MPPLTLDSPSPVWCDFEPAVDVYDGGDSFTIIIEVPGVTQSSINVVQTGRSVIVTGLRALHLEPGSHPHIEADYGRFHRQIDLPNAVQAAGRDVTYQHGLLTIHLPKCPLLASA